MDTAESLEIRDDFEERRGREDRVVGIGAGLAAAEFTMTV